jgi:site-specific DNA recombinase
MSRRKRNQLTQQAEVRRGRRALIYTRVSTEEQAQNAHSLIEQEHLLVEWCARENYEVVGRHVDAGFSARSLKRPAFQQMVDRLMRWSSIHSAEVSGTSLNKKV